jgi:hypothetical protein
MFSLRKKRGKRIFFFFFFFCKLQTRGEKAKGEKQAGWRGWGEGGKEIPLDWPLLCEWERQRVLRGPLFPNFGIVGENRSCEMFKKTIIFRVRGERTVLETFIFNFLINWQMWRQLFPDSSFFSILLGAYLYPHKSFVYTFITASSTGKWLFSSH